MVIVYKLRGTFDPEAGFPLGDIFRGARTPLSCEMKVDWLAPLCAVAKLKSILLSIPRERSASQTAKIAHYKQ